MTAILKRQKNILQLLLTLVAFGSKQSLASDDSNFDSRHAFWGEIAGMGYSRLSSQYELRLVDGIGLLAGITLLPSPHQTVCIPMAATFRIPFLVFLGLPNHQIEIGIGTTYLAEGYPDYPDLKWGFVNSIGYRYHPKEGGFVFRFMINAIGFGAIFKQGGRGTVIPAPGLSFGYAF